MNKYILSLSLLFLPALFPQTSYSENIPTSFTMEEAVLYALKHHPNIEAAKEIAEAAVSAKEAARSDFGPSVKASYGMSRFNKERNSKYEQNDVTFSIAATQPIFTGFKLLNTAQKAAIQEEIKKIQLKSSRLNITKLVQESFISYIQACESVRSTKDALKRAQSQLNMAKMGWEIGLRPRLDVLQAETDAKKTETTLIKYENSRETCLTQLHTLLDIPQQTAISINGTLNLPEFTMTPEQCLKAALTQRPALLAARKSVDSAYKDLGITRASFWPQISAIAKWSTSGSHLSADGSKYTKKDYAYSEIGITIDWTLFTSGKRIFLTRQAEHQVAAMEAEVRAVLNTSVSEVKTAGITVQDSLRAVRVAEKALASAKESYGDAKMRYETQQASYLELLTAQSYLSDAELSEINARAIYLKSLASLYEALGELHPDLTASKKPD